MIKASFADIKYDARSTMTGHMGEAILIALIIPIAFAMITGLIDGLFGYIHWSIPSFTALFTSAVTTYIILRMVIKFSRFKHDKLFDNFLGTKDGILNSIGFMLLTTLASGFYIILFWDHVVVIWELMEIMPADYFLSEPELLESFLDEHVVESPSGYILLISVIYSFILIFLTIRFSFTTYIIADSNMSLMDSLKRSWSITKGNWWRIFFFPLSFILWIFLIALTFGLAIIYVAPYISISHGALYNTLLREDGIHYDEDVNKKDSPFVKEDALDEDEKKFDKKDPFDDYYN